MWRSSWLGRGRIVLRRGPPTARMLLWRGPPAARMLQRRGPPAARMLLWRGPPAARMLLRRWASVRFPPSVLDQGGRGGSARGLSQGARGRDQRRPGAVGGNQTLVWISPVGSCLGADRYPASGQAAAARCPTKAHFISGLYPSCLACYLLWPPLLTNLASNMLELLRP